MGVIEAGRNTQLFRNKDEAVVHKQIVNLPDAGLGLGGECDRWDYERLVGGSIAFLKDPRWGIADFVPECLMTILEDSNMTSGCKCFVDMAWIKGKNLSEMEHIDQATAQQLAEFLRGCSKMAEDTKREWRVLFLPDLLCGIKKPKDRFGNFVVEEESGKLYFVDVYPLARLDSFWDRRRYKRALRNAGEATGSDEVREAVGELVEKI